MKVSSRRDFFRYMALFGLLTWSAVPLHAKITKEKIDYKDTPQDGKRCIECIHFLPDTNECKLVEGTIDPNGWCKLYYKLKPKKVLSSRIT